MVGVKPPPLKNFLYTQAGIAGYVWGGVSASGAAGGVLYAFDLDHAAFIEIPTQSPPPPLEGAALAPDPSGRLLYLFGGIEGGTAHNWLWALDLHERSWRLLASDCLSGPCPYMTTSPVFYGDISRGSFIALPGRTVIPEVERYVEESFWLDLQAAAWAPSSEKTGPLSARGDCNGDGARDAGYGDLCAVSSDWWNEPGKMPCDTLTSAPACRQEVKELAALHEMYRWGAVDIEAVRHFLIVSKGSSVLVYDMAVPSSPVRVLESRLGRKVGDLDYGGGILAAAAGSRIVLMDGTNPAALEVLGEMEVCGNVTAIEVEGSRIFFATRKGIGELDIQDPTAPQLLRFSSLVRGRHGHWSADGSSPWCGCWWGSLPDGSTVPFDVGGGFAFIGAGKDLLAVDLASGTFEVSWVRSFHRQIEALRYDGGKVYLVLSHGSRPVVAATDGALLGTHELEDWVKGVHFGDGMAHRLGWWTIQTAVWGQP